MENKFDTFEREIELFGSEYHKERYLEEELEPPNYKSKIPLGRNPDTGQVKWVDMNDDDRWGIIGRCLHPEEGIKTDNGYMSIKKLFDQYQGEKIREDEVGEWFELNEDLKTASLQSDGSIDWTHVEELYRQKIDNELISFELQNGTTIKVSKNHPLLTQNDYTKSENITEGDYIAVPRYLPDGTELDEDGIKCEEKDVWWVKVKNKKKIEYSGYIYDLTMSENRNFVCNDVISSNTGSGKTWTIKEMVSRFWEGGMGVLHLSDVKNDFANISQGDGIQKDRMNLLKNEKRTPIPVNMYVPKFLEGDYFNGTPTSDHFHTFSYSVSDLSESDFLQLLQVESTAARNIAIALYEQIEEGEADNITDLVNFLEEDESMEELNTMSKRSMKSTLESIKKQGVVSNKGSKEPLDNINDSVCVIAFENYDKYKRKSLEKLELQISITIRKLLDRIREKKVEKEQILIVVDEAHAFAGDKSELSTEDITDAVDLGRAYGLPMAFLTQKFTDLSSGIRTQCNKFLLSQNVTVEERRTVLKEAGHYQAGDHSRGKWQKLFSSMGKHEWLYVDDQEYYKVKPLSPLCKD